MVRVVLHRPLRHNSPLIVCSFCMLTASIGSWSPATVHHYSAFHTYRGRGWPCDSDGACEVHCFFDFHFNMIPMAGPTLSASRLVFDVYRSLGLAFPYNAISLDTLYAYTRYCPASKPHVVCLLYGVAGVPRSDPVGDTSVERLVLAAAW